MTPPHTGSRDASAQAAFILEFRLMFFHELRGPHCATGRKMVMRNLISFPVLLRA